jgi:hypothetical protein
MSKARIARVALDLMEKSLPRMKILLWLTAFVNGLGTEANA